MKIAIVSDTHGNVANFKKVVGWLNRENIKLILHCGDIGNPESLKESLSGFDGDFFKDTQDRLFFRRHPIFQQRHNMQDDLIKGRVNMLMRHAA